MVNEENKVVKYDKRLVQPLEFVCKILGVTQDDFASLALANLLDLELDELEYSDDTIVDPEELDHHKLAVEDVKIEADSWVLGKGKLC